LSEGNRVAKAKLPEQEGNPRSGFPDGLNPKPVKSKSQRKGEK